MQGRYAPTTISHEAGGWKLEEHRSREQPYACRYEKHYYLFTRFKQDALNFIEAQVKRQKAQGAA